MILIFLLLFKNNLAAIFTPASTQRIETKNIFILTEMDVNIMKFIINDNVNPSGGSFTFIDRTDLLGEQPYVHSSFPKLFQVIYVDLTNLFDKKKSFYLYTDQPSCTICINIKGYIITVKNIVDNQKPVHFFRFREIIDAMDEEIVIVSQSEALFKKLKRVGKWFPFYLQSVNSLKHLKAEIKKTLSELKMLVEKINSNFGICCGGTQRFDVALDLLWGKITKFLKIENQMTNEEMFETYDKFVLSILDFSKDIKEKIVSTSNNDLNYQFKLDQTCKELEIFKMYFEDISRSYLINLEITFYKLEKQRRTNGF
ncbi:hypothetical protein NGRA_0990 [Nosema granulosis]|uniref:Uncharacterized protein n=1 Tax=Nosema granulosis TaxID=83296 RepID=A0A9P6H200_9MICR|nr:hypothetical protein NGRA_0990 [Nosema granulosis]